MAHAAQRLQIIVLITIIMDQGGSGGGLILITTLSQSFYDIKTNAVAKTNHFKVGNLKIQQRPKVLGK